jgi:uncharacterized protein (TIGR00730 family)
MIKNICVYCSSSNRLDERFYEEARQLGRSLAKGGYRLVYGGGNVGLMGVLAREVHAHKGFVYGVIPRALKNREGVAYEIADELIVTDSLRERKGIMYDRADAFIALPGGLGTLEELMEVLTLKQLGYHQRPIIVINSEGFYDPLIQLFEHFREHQFVRAAYTNLFYLASSVTDAMEYLKGISRQAPY